MFTEEQIERYSRHIILKEVGGKGQKKLLDSKVMVIGAGGLGSPIALYLAAAGVGTIGIADSDVVELSNLQRQIAHQTGNIGQPKVNSIRERMEAINPDVRVDTHHVRIEAANILSVISGYDFIIDATDNFAAKFLINDACVFSGTPYSHGGILHFSGQTLTCLPGESACYRCVFPEPPPRDALTTCSRAGVLGVLPGVIGTIQATEALKYLLGIGDLLVGRFLIYDALAMNFRTVQVRRNPRCPICGENPVIAEPRDELEALGVCDLERK
ncbi:MAG TPA: molybdopterin-synthase adenylyltransferase MoeB [Geobacteraceae bacterium]